jgi:ABC-2 type transport system ATP-binding protein
MMRQRLEAIPPALAGWPLRLEAEGERLVYDFDASEADTGISRLLRDLGAAGFDYKDLETSRTSLEDIFVGLVEGRA